MLQKGSIPCLFVYIPAERHQYFSLRFSTSKIISGIFFYLWTPDAYMICCILTSKNIIPFLILAFSSIWVHSLLFLRLLIRKYIHCTLFVYLHCPKVPLLPFCKHFNILKHQRYLVSCFLVSKCVLYTVLWHFNL